MKRIRHASTPGTPTLSLAAAALLWTAGAHAELAPLRTAAALSARPSACPVRSQDAVTIWAGARNAGAGIGSKLCSTIAAVARLLPDDPITAAALVEPASKLATRGVEWVGPPELEAPFRLSRARVAVASGNPLEALEMFHQSAKLLPIAQWDPATLRDFAVCCAVVGRYEEAASIYRRLVAVSNWQGRDDRLGVMIEAAVSMLRLTQPETVEAQGYLSGLAALDADSTVAVLVGSLQAMVQHLNASSGPVEAEGLRAGFSPGIRRLARLSEHDWLLVESWLAWRNTRDDSVWSWTRDQAVPAIHRALGARLAGGG